jgi:hypothetical protein
MAKDEKNLRDIFEADTIVMRRLRARVEKLEAALADADSTYDATLAVTSHDPKFNALQMIVATSQAMTRAALAKGSEE